MLGPEFCCSQIKHDHPTTNLPYLTPKGMSGVVHANPPAFSSKVAHLIVGCLTGGFNLREN